MITADQLLVHAIGDYYLQSDWMAQSKTQRWFPAAVHATVYSVPFLLFTPSTAAFLTILLTHYFIDRYRLARYGVWAKKWMGPNKPWAECSTTGYPNDRPAWLTIWLLIIADNIMHVLINGLALKYL